MKLIDILGVVMVAIIIVSVLNWNTEPETYEQRFDRKYEELVLEWGELDRCIRVSGTKYDRSHDIRQRAAITLSEMGDMVKSGKYPMWEVGERVQKDLGTFIRQGQSMCAVELRTEF